MSTGSIARVRVGAYRFPFREPWPSAEGPQTERTGLLVALEDDEGRVGVGESAPFPGFGMESLGSSRSALHLAARYAVGLPAEHFLGAAEDLPQLAPVVASPGARAALDLALHDLAAQRAGCTVARLLGGDRAAGSAEANMVLPRLTPERVAAAARESVAAGATTLKLKVGGGPVAEDVERLRGVREAVGAGIALRLDANQAWSETEAIVAIRALAPFDLDYVEQPVAAGAIDALARVRAACGVRIAADESVVDLRAARRIVGARAADVLVVKPAALGGLAAARAVIALAREAGLGVTVTSLVESAVGRAGALHLAASLGEGVHGVATGGALADDLLSDFAARPGTIPLPAGAGIGESVRAAALARTAPIPIEATT